jgi:hypothetical protein
MPLSDRERQIIANLEKQLGGAATGHPRLAARLAGRRGSPLAVVVGVLVAFGGVLLGLVGAPVYIALGVMPVGLAVAIWGAARVVRARSGRGPGSPTTISAGG